MNPLTPDWDAVDEASLESFPASDPPARGSLRAAPSASTVSLPPPEDMPAANNTGRSLRYLGVALGALAIGFVIWRMRAR